MAITRASQARDVSSILIARSTHERGNNEKINLYKRYLYSFLVLLLIVIFLINQPDLGQTLLLGSTWITMIFVSGFNMVILLILGLAFLSVMSLLIFFFSE